jgi:catechol 2,3-dioxygenase-like lactoylglutathione lyase family enzyme
MSASFSIAGLDHVALVVRDLTASAAWYQRVLGLERVHEKVWGEFPVMMAAVAGNGFGVALFPLEGKVPQPQPDRWRAAIIDHVAFRVDRANFAAAHARLRELGIEIRAEDHIVSHSIYFHDPDGHRLEITTYEVPQQGDEK